MATNNKYDRQLRLWGAAGQKALAESRICLLGAGPTGTETLKNLVLPGCGFIMCVDAHTVTARDCENNFFVSREHIGQPRAKVTLDLLLEMNDDVRGEYRVADPVELISSPDAHAFFRSFTLVVATQLPEHHLAKLASLLYAQGIPLVVARSYGLIGHVRIVAPEHRIVESKPDNMTDDLRLEHPFPALRAYVDSFNLDTLEDTMLRAHVPYVVLLIKAVDAFTATHGRAPKSYGDRGIIEQIITGWRTDAGAQNFDEALGKVHLAVGFEPISEFVRDVLDDPAATDLHASSDGFWFVVRALRDFAAAEGHLPVSGSLPDMTATTDYFVRLQHVYKAKAEEDIANVYSRVQSLLASVGAPSTHVSTETVELMCRHARFLRVVRYRSLSQEWHPASAAKGEIAESFDSAVAFENGEQAPAVWYLALRAADRFTAAHGRIPGLTAETLETDSAEVWTHLQELCAEYELSEEHRGLISDKHAAEITRFGGAEVHVIASLLGGIASQEAVKLIAKQFIPLNNTVIYNGINGTAATMAL